MWALKSSTSGTWVSRFLVVGQLSNAEAKPSYSNPDWREHASPNSNLTETKSEPQQFTRLSIQIGPQMSTDLSGVDRLEVIFGQ